ncbi:MAG: SPOR domain-containing protein [Alphaproteobacteria bacterium]|nr:SPOR domain-containing protein [Alphaproteobacteria bacterium]
MNPKADILQGFIRQRALTRSLKTSQDLTFAGTPPVASAPPSSPTLSAQEKIKQDLDRVAAQTAHHLEPPPAKGRLFMGKLRSFFVFLLFLLAGALFFTVGFLTCYTTFPPRPMSDLSKDYMGPYGASRASQDIAQAPPLSSPVTTSYANRQAFIRSNAPQDLLADAEMRTVRESKSQARNFITRALSRVNTEIRSALGPYLGAAVAPLTTGLAQSATNQTFANDPLSGRRSGSQAQVSSQDGSAGPGASASNVAENGPAGATLKPSDTMQNQATYTILARESLFSDEALSFAQQLRDQGFGAYMVKEQTPEGQVKYVVKVGQFSHYQDARDAAALLGKQWQLPARVILFGPPM